MEISNKLDQKCVSDTLEIKKIQDMTSNPVDSVKESKKIEVMALNYKLLYIGGLLPPDEKNELWRIVLYHTYNVVLHLIYLPTILMQIYTLYYDWGDLVLTLDNMCAIGMATIGFLPPLNVRWNIAYATVHKMQTNSIFTKMSTWNNPKKKELTLQAQQKSKLSTVIGLVFVTFVAGAWVFEPYIINSMKSFIGEDLPDKLNYTGNISFGTDLTRFPFNIHPPFDTSSTITYVSVYAVISTGICILALKVVVTVTFCFGCIMFVSTHFMIVAKSIENIDIIIQDNFKITSKSNKQNLTRHLEHATSGSESNDNDDFEINSEDISLIDDCPGVELLVESIKEHQDAIQILGETNESFRSGLFTYQNLAATLFTLGLFQLAQYEEANIISTAKHLLLISFILFQGGLFCWLGDDIRIQGLSIWEAAYNLRWYRRSRKFNMLLKMIILRGQISNYVYIGRFHKLTLEHFANVVNSAYSIFTILLRFK